MNSYQELGLQKIVNASGRMTALGVSTVNEETARAMCAASMSFVAISDLIDAAGKVIASHVGSEDACPTAGAAAGIAIATAACIAKNSVSITQQLPCSDGLANEVIIQKGHCINFGAPVTQMIRLGGGKVVEVGETNHTLAQNISDAVTEKTAALIYVKSHHCVQKGMVSLEEMIAISKKMNIPLIVDAAAEEDLKTYIARGATLVIYSGAKAIEGPTSGFIAGKKELIASCKLQYFGIGRSMKIGKEGIMGLLKALDLYEAKDMIAIRKKEMEKLQYIQQQLAGIEGLKIELVKDSAGREIYRLKVTVDPEKAKLNCSKLIEGLEAGDVSIRIRDHFSNLGIIEIDPRPLLDGDEVLIAEKFKELLS